MEEIPYISGTLADNEEGIIHKIASAIYNDVVSGLRGYHHNPSMSLQQLEDEVVEDRLSVIKEYQLKGILPIKELLTSINCIQVDCKDLDRCKCSSKITGKPIAHFEIPQLITDFGKSTIEYIGSTDRQNPFIVYTDAYVWKWYQKYRKRAQNRPFVYIDTTPNEHGLLDGYIFNAPFIDVISITAIFKDPRQAEEYSCCPDMTNNLSFLLSQIKERLTKKKLYYYRQLVAPVLPNDQTYSAG